MRHALGANSINVIDLDKNAMSAKSAKRHASVAVPGLGKGFSIRRENRSRLVDSKTLKALSKVDTGMNPHAIL